MLVTKDKTNVFDIDVEIHENDVKVYVRITSAEGKQKEMHGKINDEKKI